MKIYRVSYAIRNTRTATQYDWGYFSTADRAKAEYQKCLEYCELAEADLNRHLSFDKCVVEPYCIQPIELDKPIKA